MWAVSLFFLSPAYADDVRPLPSLISESSLRLTTGTRLRYEAYAIPSAFRSPVREDYAVAIQDIWEGGAIFEYTIDQSVLGQTRGTQVLTSLDTCDRGGGHNPNLTTDANCGSPVRPCGISRRQAPDILWWIRNFAKTRWCDGNASNPSSFCVEWADVRFFCLRFASNRREATRPSCLMTSRIPSFSASVRRIFRGICGLSNNQRNLPTPHFPRPTFHAPRLL